MELPVVEERIVTGRAEMSVPPGAYVLERSEYQVDSLGQYIRYIPRQEKGRKGKWVDGDSVGQK